MESQQKLDIKIAKAEDDLSYWKGLQNYLLGPSDSGDKKLHRQVNGEITAAKKRVKALFGRKSK